MTDKKDDSTEEPEVIIVAPEDQDVMPPGDKDGNSSENAETIIDAEATPVDQAEAGKRGSRLGLWIVLLVAAAFVGGFVAWPKLAPTLDPWLPDAMKPGTSRLAEVTGALDELAVRIATLKNNAVDPNTVVDLESRIKAELDSLQKEIADLRALPVLPEGQIDQMSAQMATLAQQVQDIQARLTEETTSLRDQLAGLVSSPVTSDDPPTEGSATSLPADVTARLKALSAGFADLAERTVGLEEKAATAAPVVPVEHAHDNLVTEVASLKSMTDDLVARLAAAEARLAAVADANNGGSGAALVAAAGQLRSRVESGQDFVADLGTLRELAGDDEALKSLLVDLEATMAGVPTLAILRSEFDAVAGDVLAAARAPAQNWMEKVWRRLSSMVSIRRKGEVAGDDPAALVARAEVRLAAGDLTAAVHELKALPEAATAVAAPWMQRAESRLKAMAALEQLTRQAVSRLARPSGTAADPAGAIK